MLSRKSDGTPPRQLKVTDPFCPCAYPQHVHVHTPVFLSGGPPPDCAEDAQNSPEHTPILSTNTFPTRARSPTRKKLWPVADCSADPQNPTMCGRCERFCCKHITQQTLSGCQAGRHLTAQLRPTNDLSLFTVVLQLHRPQRNSKGCIPKEYGGKML